MSKRFVLSAIILLTSFTGLYGQVNPDHVDKEWLESILLNWVKADNDFARACVDNSFYNTRLSFISGSMAKLSFYCKDEYGHQFFGDSKAKISVNGDKINAKYYHAFNLTAYRNGTLPEDYNKRLFYPVGTFNEYDSDGYLRTVSKWENGEIKSRIDYGYSYLAPGKYENRKKTGAWTFQRIDDSENILYNISFRSNKFQVPFSQSASIHEKYSYDTEKIRQRTFYMQRISRYGYVNEAASIYDKEGKLDYTYVKYIDDETSKTSYRYIYVAYDKENGMRKEEGEYKTNNHSFDTRIVSDHSRKSGKWKYYFSDSKQVKEEGTYKQVRGEGISYSAKKEGLWKEYYKSGAIKYKQTYNEGKRIGEMLAYHENGTMWYKGQYKEGSVFGTWNYWRDDGSLFKMKTYDRDKVISFEGSFRMMGAWVTKNYDKKGRLTSEGFEQSGSKKRGYWKYYYENGQLKAEGNFNFDKKEGYWKHYNDNGKIYAKHPFKDGKGNGEFEWYHEDGISISTKVTYTGGKMTGDKVRYFKNGDVHKILTYSDGKLMNIKKCVDRKGNTLEYGTLKDGNGTNIRYYWEDDKKVLVNRVETYVDGVLQN